MSPCPSFDTLRGLGDNAVEVAAFDAIERHVDSCPNCRARLDDLRHHGTLGDPTLPIARAIDAWPPEVPGFTVERRIGLGGMGAVYLATRNDNGQQVALKLIEAGPNLRPIWRREVRALETLNHPDVVRLFGVVEGEGFVCLVLEYVPGGPLSARLATPTPPREAARLVEITARAVAAIHEAGLLHLDLKPSNLLIDGPPDATLSEIRPKVADFGLALVWDVPDATWTVAVGPRGTPAYMAPEQLTNGRDEVGPAADIFALGAILYGALTGRPPFLAETREATYRQLLDADPVPPRRLNPEVPRDLETICLACLQKEPSRRYPSAEALADDLRSHLKGRKIRRRPSPRIARTYRWGRRHPGLAGLALATLMLTLLLIGLLANSAREARVERDLAEADRLRAVENLRLSSHALLQLTWLTDEAFHELNWMDQETIHRVIGQIEEVYTPLFEARARGQIDDSNRLTLGILGVGLGMRLPLIGRDQKVDEVLAVARDTLRACHRRNPEIEVCRWMLIRALAESAILAAFDGGDRLDEAIAHAREAGALIVPYPESPQLRTAFARLADANSRIAEILADGGDAAGSREFHRANERLFSTHQGSLAIDPANHARYAASLAGLGKRGAAIDQMRSLVAAIGPSEPPPRAIAAFWLMRGSGPLHALLEGDRGDVEPTGVELYRILLDEFDRIGLTIEPFESAPAAFDGLLQDLTGVFGRQGIKARAQDRHDDSVRIARCVQRLAEHLVALQPNEPGGYQMLSEACIQHAKNAWITEDYSEIRRWTARSLDHARRADTLDPEDVYTQFLLRDRLRRLDELPNQ